MTNFKSNREILPNLQKKSKKKHPDISPSVSLAISSLFYAILCSRFNILFHFRFPVVLVYSCFQIVHTVSPNKNKNQYSRFSAIKLYVECFEAFIYHLSFLKLARISRDSLGLSVATDSQTLGICYDIVHAICFQVS